MNNERRLSTVVAAIFSAAISTAPSLAADDAAVAK
jgi:hypothetical protein